MSLRKILAVSVALLAAVTGARYLGSPQHTHAAFDNTDPDSLYSPILAGEELPDGYRRSLSRDAIRPIYDPTFVSASRAGWEDDTLIVGLEINGDARAYPVSYMNRREIVNDHVGGTPVLVTW